MDIEVYGGETYLYHIKIETRGINGGHVSGTKSMAVMGVYKIRLLMCIRRRENVTLV